MQHSQKSGNTPSWYMTNATNAAIKEDKLLIERFCQKDLVSDIKEEVIQ
ncbi:hypothetical protein SMU99_00560 [Streptococcus mutans 24]|uniref:Uncharacterized protein n=1 Tax=Streptococcus mutans SM6 TaxID=857119 RepID=A0A829BUW5_STRMG|nr:hypothetical protein SMU3_05306 [Streptococcus mutans 11A1]EMB56952.1 hypothetical protein SMU88_03427 [Streptococcus mutans NLML8]EMB70784.1 hypothetical protein SMU33_03998 [Streptococcus mutans 11SSST2]EMB94969.1 hypothetical protein SMU62_08218 [Streptococcus mutans M21]EMB95529.1 hypothetical protein SMU61_04240 [Streptococcus mutans G123]EMC23695.1 hypothetical protein SMU82_06224 [Streptococcus mutans SM6]EMC42962.1 hypothetical protein SMU98_06697 [Streptococcus mutans SM1]EMC4704